MKDILIIGGSPFVNTVNLLRIDTERFDILCINRPVHNIPVHYLICHDSNFRACHTQKDVKRIKEQGLNPVFIAPKTEFIHSTTGWESEYDKINHDINKKWLGFVLYTCSSALNFAYLKGYKNVYLIGVDLEENDKPFTHWHGVTNTKKASKHCAKIAKQYLYRYKKYLNIYQCNPKVIPDWEVEYYSVDQLYSRQ